METLIVFSFLLSALFGALFVAGVSGFNSKTETYSNRTFWKLIIGSLGTGIVLGLILFSLLPNRDYFASFALVFIWALCAIVKNELRTLN